MVLQVGTMRDLVEEMLHGLVMELMVDQMQAVAKQILLVQ